MKKTIAKIFIGMALLFVGIIGFSRNDEAYAAEPVYQVYNPGNGDRLYTTSLSEQSSLVSVGWHKQGIAFYGLDSGSSVIRLYNPNNGMHYYTIYQTEKNQLVQAGWRHEGVAFYANYSDQATPSSTRIYNLYQPTTGAYYYTASYAEAVTLSGIGWRNQGVAFAV